MERLLHRPRNIAATYGLILTPARELAVQVAGMVGKLAQFTDVRVALVVGGLSLPAQAVALRARPEIVVGTPVSEWRERERERERDVTQKPSRAGAGQGPRPGGGTGAEGGRGNSLFSPSLAARLPGPQAQSVLGGRAPLVLWFES